MRRLFNKRTYIVVGILCFVFMWLQFGTESYAFTRTTGEVTGSSVKVRSSASTDAAVVASVRAGDDLDVTDAVNGTDGKVWYKIVVSADQVGYIRSDFVKLEGGEQAPSTLVPGTTQVTPMDEQDGHTNTNNVKVRQQASTGSAEIDRLNQDIVFAVLGTAQDADGKTWYQILYIKDGVEVNGFIRSDLVTLMKKEPEELESEEAVEVEDPDAEEPTVPIPEKNYEAVYTTDENGEYIWYLYDRTAGQRYKVDQLLQVDKEGQEELEDLSSANFGLKIALIISICLLIMMIVAMVFYILKMKEEEEENAYRRRTTSAPSPVVRRSQTTARANQTVTRTSGVKPQTLTKQQAGQNSKTQGVQQSKTNASQSERTQNAQQTATKSQQVVQERVVSRPSSTNGQQQRQKTSWKAKNFLEDNDEFEFGFLDFDEDDE